MIKLLQQLEFYFVIGLIVFALYINLLILFSEVKFRSRTSIKYKNFQKKKKLFTFKVNKKIIIGVTAYFILSAAVSVLLLNNPVYTVYIYLLGFLELLLFLGLLLHISSSKYNKDLSLYENYYQIIKESFENREKLVENIHELEKQYQSLKKECSSLNEEFKNYFNSFSGFDGLTDTLIPLENVIEFQTQLKNGFDYDITKKFNEALKNYLITGQIHSLDIQAFKFINPKELEQIMKTIIDDQRTLIYHQSLEKIKQNQMISLKQFIQLILKLDKMNIKLKEDFIVEVLNYGTNHKGSKKELIEVLYKSRLMSCDLLCHAVNPQDMAWVYDYSLGSYYEKEELIKIEKSIIANNAINCGYHYLLTLDHRYYALVMKALNKVKVQNEIYDIFTLFNQISSYDGFYDDVKKYENMALVMKYYDEDDKKDPDRLSQFNEIIKNKTFEENREVITSTYEAVKCELKDEFKMMFETLLLYRNSSAVKLNYFDFDKIITTYSEYHKNFNVLEISVLNQLLQSIILLYENDEKMIMNVYQLISHTMKKEDLVYLKRIENGQKLLKNCKGEMNSFVNVVSRIEKDRLIIDEIMSL